MSKLREWADNEILKIAETQLSRDEIRHYEISREFDQEHESVWEELLYTCPWFAFKDSAGVVYFGPETTSAMAQQWQEYRLGRNPFNDSLWDIQIEIEAKEKYPRKELARLERADRHQVESFMQAFPNALSRAEKIVYVDYWLNNLTVGRIAKKHGLKPTTVQTHIKNIRDKARGKKQEK